jgi:ornithine carbamoyltransferase
MDVVVGHPEEFPLQPGIVEKANRNAAETGARVGFARDMDEAVSGADVVIPKNWGGFARFDPYVDDEEHRREMKANLEKHRDWILDGRRLSLARAGARVMHALPADRGKEATDEVLDGEQSIIYDEAENRLHTSKAVLALLMGGTRGGRRNGPRGPRRRAG